MDDKSTKLEAKRPLDLELGAVALANGVAFERKYVQLDRERLQKSGLWQILYGRVAQAGVLRPEIWASNFFQDLKRRRRPFDSQVYIRERFIWAMQRGLNSAIGYLPPREETSVPVLIPKRCWDHPSINWETAELSGAGFHFVDVRVLISTFNYNRHDLHCQFDPVTELAPFRPSDEERDQLGIAATPHPAEQSQLPELLMLARPEPDQKTEPPRKIGRPTYQAHIVAAFSAIEKDLNWTEKQLAAAVHDRVKADIGKADDKGLGDDAILKHVRPMWHDLKNTPR